MVINVYSEILRIKQKKNQRLNLALKKLLIIAIVKLTNKQLCKVTGI